MPHAWGDCGSGDRLRSRAIRPGRMEHLWSRAVATGGKWSGREKWLRQANSVAVGCDRLPRKRQWLEQTTWAAVGAPAAEGGSLGTGFGDRFDSLAVGLGV
jgi:hypothetical protein